MSEEMEKVVEQQQEGAPKPIPTATEVRAKLAEYKVEAGVIDRVIDELGVETLSELKALEVEDLTQAGVKIAKARSLLKELQDADKQSEQVSAGGSNRTIDQASMEALLPNVPNDESWLSDLKASGVLKVGESTYIAAIRAALAERVGLYNIPKSLSDAMEAYADETEEQVPEQFFALRNALTTRAYGEIFSAIPGLNASFITEKRRKEFLNRMNNELWPAIKEAFQVLEGWYQTYCSGYSDPSALLTAISQALNGGRAVGVNMIAPPDSAQLHDAADTLIAVINRVFRGTGVQVSAAMALESTTIRDVLNNQQLPAMVGVRNREEMLRKIGANVSSNYVRLEKNLTKFVLGFVQYSNVTSDMEDSYFVALRQLGRQINWEDLLGDGKQQGKTSLTGKNVL